MKLSTILEAMSGPEFYNDLTGGSFQPTLTFPVKMNFTVDSKKVALSVPVTVDNRNLEKEVEQYLTAPANLKKQFDTYAYWYDNFNKLVFDNMPESDACLFLAACAYCSANTALDQNILEAAKLFSAVKQDFATEGGRKALEDLSTNVKDNMNNQQLAHLQSYEGKGSAYANLLAPKKDYKGGKVDAGPRKGQDDVFSEITVSNAKIPNFNLFVKYYLGHNGQVSKDQLFQDFKSGKLEIGGTKISSFFMNLIFPGYKWDGNIDPATVDRWMIRVFFDIPLKDMVDKDISDWIQHLNDNTPVKAGKKDTEETLLKKKAAALQKRKDDIVNAAVMQLFGSDVVRQNLVKILHEAGQKMGLTSYQLQALAWVNIRERYNEPKAKFAKFEDVMDYAEEAARSIVEVDPDVNKVLSTIKVLASGPRFKFKDKQDVIDTIQNRDKYENVYRLPPKNDVEAKKQEEANIDGKRWTMMRVATEGTNVDIFDLAVSKKKPVNHIDGASRKEALKAALEWILAYNPTPTQAQA